MKFNNKFAVLFVALCVGLVAAAESLVILHTNDTHSNIDPNDQGRGGILQRKAIIDSVRKAEKNVLLVDAGDIVQGTLFFKFFRGDVEYPLMNLLGYDIEILGNHEFDNGVDELAGNLKKLKATRLSANYDFKGTPLDGLFMPYTIKKIGGRKIGFIGLNVDPESLISRENIKGVKFNGIISTANTTAAFLRKEKKCDLVVAVTHIGYTPDSPGKTTDVDLAKASRDIDIIIGGHSHTTVTPGAEGKYPSLVKNADGKYVLIAQTGKYGRNLGYIKIDLDKLGDAQGYGYELIPVTDRFPSSKLDKNIVKFLEPYRSKVDSVNARVIAISEYDLDSDEPDGGYAHWAADYAAYTGQKTLDSLRVYDPGLPARVDMGFMNVGGIRKSMSKGDVTEGQILSTFPFANRMVLMDMKGSDIIDAMKVAAIRGGEGVSENVRVVLDPSGKVQNVIIDGDAVNPEKHYTVSTIDYVAEGNDDLRSFANGKILWRDNKEMSAPMMRYVEHLSRLGLKIAPDLSPRFVKSALLP